MRWDRLFDDLAAQLEAAEGAELGAEVGERTRIERARVELTDRLRGWLGQPVLVHTLGAGRVEGLLSDAGPGWLVVHGTQPALVVQSAVLVVRGLGRVAQPPQGPVARGYGLGAVLRGVARDRSPLGLLLRDGQQLTGTLDAVRADHVDLAEHDLDLARRREAVRGVCVVPFDALAVVRPAPGTTML